MAEDSGHLQKHLESKGVERLAGSGFDVQLWQVLSKELWQKM